MQHFHESPATICYDTQPSIDGWSAGRPVNALCAWQLYCAVVCSPVCSHVRQRSALKLKDAVRSGNSNRTKDCRTCYPARAVMLTRCQREQAKSFHGQYMSTELYSDNSSSLSLRARGPFLISYAAITARSRSPKVMPSG